MGAEKSVPDSVLPLHWKYSLIEGDKLGHESEGHQDPRHSLACWQLTMMQLKSL